MVHAYPSTEVVSWLSPNFFPLHASYIFPNSAVQLSYMVGITLVPGLRFMQITQTEKGKAGTKWRASPSYLRNARNRPRPSNAT
jgi:hypothetical protein